MEALRDIGDGGAERQDLEIQSCILSTWYRMLEYVSNLLTRFRKESP